MSVARWTEIMECSPLQGMEIVVPDVKLIDGQHRLRASAGVRRRCYYSRRRIVQVSTRKYRARKGRRRSGR